MKTGNTLQFCVENCMILNATTAPRICFALMVENKTALLVAAEHILLLHARGLQIRFVVFARKVFFAMENKVIFQF